MGRNGDNSWRERSASRHPGIRVLATNFRALLLRGLNPEAPKPYVHFFFAIPKPIRRVISRITIVMTYIRALRNSHFYLPMHLQVSPKCQSQGTYARFISLSSGAAESSGCGWHWRASRGACSRQGGAFRAGAPLGGDGVPLRVSLKGSKGIFGVRGSYKWSYKSLNIGSTGGLGSRGQGCRGLRFRGLRFGGLGLRGQGVRGLRFRGLRFWGLGFRVWWLRVWRLGVGRTKPSGFPTWFLVPRESNIP